jgi:hypothetical protein
MKLIRVLRVACLGGALALPLGCDTGPTGEAEEITPDEQADIDAMRKAYSEGGRFGPGGQNTPTPPPAAGGGEPPAGGTSQP